MPIIFFIYAFLSISLSACDGLRTVEQIMMKSGIHNFNNVVTCTGVRATNYNGSRSNDLIY
jgi:hypothetical protein